MARLLHPGGPSTLTQVHLTPRTKVHVAGLAGPDDLVVVPHRGRQRQVLIVKTLDAGSHEGAAVRALAGEHPVGATAQQNTLWAEHVRAHAGEHP